MDRIRANLARKEYNDIINPKAKPGPLGIGSLRRELDAFRGSSASAEGQKEFKFVLTYGFGFISVMFLGFLSGYMAGIHIFRLSH